MEVLNLNDYPFMKEKIFKKIDSLLGNINFIIAGGSVSNLFHFQKLEEEQDIDIYFENEKDFIKAVEAFSEKTSFARTTNFTKTYYVDDRKIQLIKKEFGDVKKILSTFDLGCCKIAIKNDKIYNQSTKNIDIQHIDAMTPSRVLKYYERGFNVLEKDKNLIKNLLLEDKKIYSYYSKEEISSKEAFADFLVLFGLGYEPVPTISNTYANSLPNFVKEIVNDLELHPELLKIFKENYSIAKTFRNCSYTARIALCLHTGERKYCEEVYKKNPEFLI